MKPPKKQGVAHAVATKQLGGSIIPKIKTFPSLLKRAKATKEGAKRLVPFSQKHLHPPISKLKVEQGQDHTKISDLTDADGLFKSGQESAQGIFPIQEINNNTEMECSSISYATSVSLSTEHIEEPKRGVGNHHPTRQPRAMFSKEEHKPQPVPKQMNHLTTQDEEAKVKVKMNPLEEQLQQKRKQIMELDRGLRLTTPSPVKLDKVVLHHAQVTSKIKTIPLETEQKDQTRKAIDMKMIHLMHGPEMEKKPKSSEVTPPKPAPPQKKIGFHKVKSLLNRIPRDSPDKAATSNSDGKLQSEVLLNRKEKILSDSFQAQMEPPRIFNLCDEETKNIKDTSCKVNVCEETRESEGANVVNPVDCSQTIPEAQEQMSHDNRPTYGERVQTAHGSDPVENLMRKQLGFTNLSHREEQQVIGGSFDEENEANRAMLESVDIMDDDENGYFSEDYKDDVIKLKEIITLEVPLEQWNIPSELRTTRWKSGQRRSDRHQLPPACVVKKKAPNRVHSAGRNVPVSIVGVSSSSSGSGRTPASPICLSESSLQGHIYSGHLENQSLRSQNQKVPSSRDSTFFRQANRNPIDAPDYESAVYLNASESEDIEREGISAHDTKCYKQNDGTSFTGNNLLRILMASEADLAVLEKQPREVPSRLSGEESIGSSNYEDDRKTTEEMENVLATGSLTDHVLLMSQNGTRIVEGPSDSKDTQALSRSADPPNLPVLLKRLGHDEGTITTQLDAARKTRSGDMTREIIEALEEGETLAAMSTLTDEVWRRETVASSHCGKPRGDSTVANSKITIMTFNSKQEDRSKIDPPVAASKAEPLEVTRLVQDDEYDDEQIVVSSSFHDENLNRPSGPLTRDSDLRRSRSRFSQNENAISRSPDSRQKDHSFIDPPVATLNEEACDAARDLTDYGEHKKQMALVSTPSDEIWRQPAVALRSPKSKRSSKSLRKSKILKMTPLAESPRNNDNLIYINRPEHEIAVSNRAIHDEPKRVPSNSGSRHTLPQEIILNDDELVSDLDQSLRNFPIRRIVASGSFTVSTFDQSASYDSDAENVDRYQPRYSLSQEKTGSHDSCLSDRAEKIDRYACRSSQPLFEVEDRHPDQEWKKTALVDSLTQGSFTLKASLETTDPAGATDSSKSDMVGQSESHRFSETKVSPNHTNQVTISFWDSIFKKKSNPKQSENAGKSKKYEVVRQGNAKDEHKVVEESATTGIEGDAKYPKVYNGDPLPKIQSSRAKQSHSASNQRSETISTPKLVRAEKSADVIAVCRANQSNVQLSEETEIEVKISKDSLIPDGDLLDVDSDKYFVPDKIHENSKQIQVEESKSLDPRGEEDENYQAESKQEYDTVNKFLDDPIRVTRLGATTTSGLGEERNHCPPERTDRRTSSIISVDRTRQSTVQLLEATKFEGRALNVINAPKTSDSSIPIGYSHHESVEKTANSDKYLVSDIINESNTQIQDSGVETFDTGREVDENTSVEPNQRPDTEAEKFSLDESIREGTREEERNQNDSERVDNASAGSQRDNITCAEDRVPDKSPEVTESLFDFKDEDSDFHILSNSTSMIDDRIDKFLTNITSFADGSVDPVNDTSKLKHEESSTMGDSNRKNEKNYLSDLQLSDFKHAKIMNRLMAAASESSDMIEIESVTSSSRSHFRTLTEDKDESHDSNNNPASSSSKAKTNSGISRMNTADCEDPSETFSSTISEPPTLSTDFSFNLSSETKSKRVAFPNNLLSAIWSGDEIVEVVQFQTSNSHRIPDYRLRTMVASKSFPDASVRSSTSEQESWNSPSHSIQLLPTESTDLVRFVPSQMESKSPIEKERTFQDSDYTTNSKKSMISSSERIPTQRSSSSIADEGSNGTKRREESTLTIGDEKAVSIQGDSGDYVWITKQVSGDEKIFPWNSLSKTSFTETTDHKIASTEGPISMSSKTKVLPRFHEHNPKSSDSGTATLSGAILHDHHDENCIDKKEYGVNSAHKKNNDTRTHRARDMISQASAGEQQLKGNSLLHRQPQQVNLGSNAIPVESVSPELRSPQDEEWRGAARLPNSSPTELISIKQQDSKSLKSVSNHSGRHRGHSIDVTTIRDGQTSSIYSQGKGGNISLAHNIMGYAEGRAVSRNSSSSASLESHPHNENLPDSNGTPRSSGEEIIDLTQYQFDDNVEDADLRDSPQSALSEIMDLAFDKLFSPTDKTSQAHKECVDDSMVKTGANSFADKYQSYHSPSSFEKDMSVTMFENEIDKYDVISLSIADKVDDTPSLAIHTSIIPSTTDETAMTVQGVEILKAIASHSCPTRNASTQRTRPDASHGEVNKDMNIIPQVGSISCVQQKVPPLTILQKDGRDVLDRYTTLSKMCDAKISHSQHTSCFRESGNQVQELNATSCEGLSVLDPHGTHTNTSEKHGTQFPDNGTITRWDDQGYESNPMFAKNFQSPVRDGVEPAFSPQSAKCGSGDNEFVHHPPNDPNQADQVKMGRQRTNQGIDNIMDKADSFISDYIICDDDLCGAVISMQHSHLGTEVELRKDFLDVVFEGAERAFCGLVPSFEETVNFSKTNLSENSNGTGRWTRHQNENDIVSNGPSLSSIGSRQKTVHLVDGYLDRVFSEDIENSYDHGVSDRLLIANSLAKGADNDSSHKLSIVSKSKTDAINVYTQSQYNEASTQTDKTILNDRGLRFSGARNELKVDVMNDEPHKTNRSEMVEKSNPYQSDGCVRKGDPKIGRDPPRRPETYQGFKKISGHVTQRTSLAAAAPTEESRLLSNQCTPSKFQRRSSQRPVPEIISPTSKSQIRQKTIQPSVNPERWLHHEKVAHKKSQGPRPEQNLVRTAVAKPAVGSILCESVCSPSMKTMWPSVSERLAADTAAIIARGLANRSIKDSSTFCSHYSKDEAHTPLDGSEDMVQESEKSTKEPIDSVATNLTETNQGEFDFETKTATNDLDWEESFSVVKDGNQWTNPHESTTSPNCSMGTVGSECLMNLSRVESIESKLGQFVILKIDTMSTLNEEEAIEVFDVETLDELQKSLVESTMVKNRGECVMEVLQNPSKSPASTSHSMFLTSSDPYKRELSSTHSSKHWIDDDREKSSTRENGGSKTASVVDEGSRYSPSTVNQDRSSLSTDHLLSEDLVVLSRRESDSLDPVIGPSSTSDSSSLKQSVSRKSSSTGKYSVPVLRYCSSEMEATSDDNQESCDDDVETNFTCPSDQRKLVNNDRNSYQGDESGFSNTKSEAVKAEELEIEKASRCSHSDDTSCTSILLVEHDSSNKKRVYKRPILQHGAQMIFDPLHLKGVSEDIVAARIVTSHSLMKSPSYSASEVTPLVNNKFVPSCRERHFSRNDLDSLAMTARHFTSKSTDIIPDGGLALPVQHIVIDPRPRFVQSTCSGALIEHSSPRGDSFANRPLLTSDDLNAVEVNGDKAESVDVPLLTSDDLNAVEVDGDKAESVDVPLMTSDDLNTVKVETDTMESVDVVTVGHQLCREDDLCDASKIEEGCSSDGYRDEIQPLQDTLTDENSIHGLDQESELNVLKKAFPYFDDNKDVDPTCKPDDNARSDDIVLNLDASTASWPDFPHIRSESSIESLENKYRSFANRFQQTNGAASNYASNELVKEWIARTDVNPLGIHIVQAMSEASNDQTFGKRIVVSAFDIEQIEACDAKDYFIQAHDWNDSENFPSWLHIVDGRDLTEDGNAVACSSDLPRLRHINSNLCENTPEKSIEIDKGNIYEATGDSCCNRSFRELADKSEEKLANESSDGHHRLLSSHSDDPVMKNSDSGMHDEQQLSKYREGNNSTSSTKENTYKPHVSKVDGQQDDNRCMSGDSQLSLGTGASERTMTRSLVNIADTEVDGMYGSKISGQQGDNRSMKGDPKILLEAGATTLSLENVNEGVLGVHGEGVGATSSSLVNESYEDFGVHTDATTPDNCLELIDADTTMNDHVDSCHKTSQRVKAPSRSRRPLTPEGDLVTQVTEVSGDGRYSFVMSAKSNCSFVDSPVMSQCSNPDKILAMKVPQRVSAGVESDKTLIEKEFKALTALPDIDMRGCLKFLCGKNLVSADDSPYFCSSGHTKSLQHDVFSEGFCVFSQAKTITRSAKLRRDPTGEILDPLSSVSVVSLPTTANDNPAYDESGNSSMSISSNSHSDFENQDIERIQKYPHQETVKYSDESDHTVSSREEKMTPIPVARYKSFQNPLHPTEEQMHRAATMKCDYDKLKRFGSHGDEGLYEPPDISGKSSSMSAGNIRFLGKSNQDSLTDGKSQKSGSSHESGRLPSPPGKISSSLLEQDVQDPPGSQGSSDHVTVNYTNTVEDDFEEAASLLLVLTRSDGECGASQEILSGTGAETRNHDDSLRTEMKHKEGKFPVINVVSSSSYSSASDKESPSLSRNALRSSPHRLKSILERLRGSKRQGSKCDLSSKSSEPEPADVDDLFQRYDNIVRHMVLLDDQRLPQTGARQKMHDIIDVTDAQSSSHSEASKEKVALHHGLTTKESVTKASSFGSETTTPSQKARNLRVQLDQALKTSAAIRSTQERLGTELNIFKNRLELQRRSISPSTRRPAQLTHDLSRPYENRESASFSNRLREHRRKMEETYRRSVSPAQRSSQTDSSSPNDHNLDFVVTADKPNSPTMCECESLNSSAPRDHEGNGQRNTPSPTLSEAFATYDQLAQSRKLKKQHDAKEDAAASNFIDDCSSRSNDSSSRSDTGDLATKNSYDEGNHPLPRKRTSIVFGEVMSEIPLSQTSHTGFQSSTPVQQSMAGTNYDRNLPIEREVSRASEARSLTPQRALMDEDSEEDDLFDFEESSGDEMYDLSIGKSDDDPDEASINETSKSSIKLQQLESILNGLRKDGEQKRKEKEAEDKQR